MWKNIKNNNLLWERRVYSILPEVTLHSGHALLTSKSNSLLCRHFLIQEKQKQWLQFGNIPKVCSALFVFFVTTSKHIPHVFSSISEIWSIDKDSSTDEVLGPLGEYSLLKYVVFGNFILLGCSAHAPSVCDDNWVVSFWFRGCKIKNVILVLYNKIIIFKFFSWK